MCSNYAYEILCLEQLHGTEVWNSCMEWKSETDAWNRAGTEIVLSGTAAWNGSMEQSWNGNTLSGTAAWKGSLEQSWNRNTLYFVWNSCIERKSEGFTPLLGFP